MFSARMIETNHFRISNAIFPDTLLSVSRRIAHFVTNTCVLYLVSGPSGSTQIETKTPRLLSNSRIFIPHSSEVIAGLQLPPGSRRLPSDGLRRQRTLEQACLVIAWTTLSPEIRF